MCSFLLVFWKKRAIFSDIWREKRATTHTVTVKMRERETSMKREKNEANRKSSVYLTTMPLCRWFFVNFDVWSENEIFFCHRRVASHIDSLWKCSVFTLKSICLAPVNFQRDLFSFRKRAEKMWCRVCDASIFFLATPYCHIFETLYFSSAAHFEPKVHDIIIDRSNLKHILWLAMAWYLYNV